MGPRRKILYVQHAATLGGSVVSLREVVLDAIAAGNDCTVICPNDNIANVYRLLGADVAVTAVATFDHNSAFHYRTTPIDIYRLARLFFRTLRTQREMRKIALRLRPDIVHLNSSTLILYGRLFQKLGIPVVLHIRETIVHGYLGLRKARMRQLANRNASHIIYISEYEYGLLKTSPSKSSVIYNYVHEAPFLQSAQAANYSKSPSVLRFITLGGLAQLKGADVILTALLSVPEGELVMLGADDPRQHPEALVRQEGSAYADRILSLLRDSRLAGRVTFGGKVDEPSRWIVSADVVIFWAARPHFPRPVFEAWLLGKTVVYYNPFFASNKISDSNAIVVPHADAETLAKALASVPTNPVNDDRVKAATRRIARECFTEHNFKEIERVYDTVLNNPYHQETEGNII